MRFTESALKYIKSELNDEINGIIININKSCCSIGEDIRIAFGNIKDNYVVIDGIRVRYDNYFKEYIDGLVIDYKSNMIMFEGE